MLVKLSMARLKLGGCSSFEFCLCCLWSTGKDLLGFTIVGFEDWVRRTEGGVILVMRFFILVLKLSAGAEHSLTKDFLILISTENGFSEIT